MWAIQLCGKKKALAHLDGWHSLLDRCNVLLHNRLVCIRALHSKINNFLRQTCSEHFYKQLADFFQLLLLGRLVCRLLINNTAGIVKLRLEFFVKKKNQKKKKPNVSSSSHALTNTGTAELTIGRFTALSSTKELDSRLCIPHTCSDCDLTHTYVQVQAD